MASWIPITLAKPGDPISSAKFNEQGLGNLQYLYDALNALTARVGTNESAITALASRVTTNENAIAALTPRVTTNENAISALTTRVTANESAITTVQSRVTAVEATQPLYGTWTPTLTADGGASGQSYGSNTTGSYIKIGRLVHVTGSVELTLKGTLTGTVQLAALPFPVGGVTASGLHVNFWYALASAYTDLTLQLIYGTSKAYLRGNTAAAASQGAVAGTAITDIFQLGFSGTYHAT